MTSRAARLLGFLFATAAAFVGPLPVRAIEPPPAATLATLADRIRRDLPKGWSVEEDPANGALVVSRDEKVLAMSYAPGLSGDEKPEKVTFAFCFRLGPLVGAKEFRDLAGRNEKTRRELAQLKEEILRAGVSGKGDSYILPPASEKGRALVLQFNELSKSFHRLPDFSFEDASIYPDSPWIADDAIRRECLDVRARVEGLFTRY